MKKRHKLRKLTITKLDENCWKVEGKNMWILTDTKKNAKEWKEIFKNEK